MRFLISFNVPLAWRNQYCGVFSLEYNGSIYYFLDNEYYFNRDIIYGHFDDAERFAFFSRAILEMISKIDFKPEILHSNDWQTALVPVFYRLIYRFYPEYGNIKNIFNIHNIHYQGKFDRNVIPDIVGLHREDFSILTYDGCANFMKGAIETAEKVITVSKTYAKEILDPWFSHDLHHCLLRNSHKLVGIQNGIDQDVYNPETDKEIYQNYSKDTTEKKHINKEKLCSELNLKYDKNVPLVGMVSRLVPEKGLDLLKAVLEDIMQNENVLFVALGSGEHKYESFFDYIQSKYPGRFSSYHGFAPGMSRKIYAASDIFLMPSKTEPCGLAQMIALRYGAVPVVRDTGGLSDSIKDSGDGSGNGFVFKNYDPGDMLWALKRALMGFENHSGWDILVKRAMCCDNSWKNSAEKYKKIYEETLSIL